MWLQYQLRYRLKVSANLGLICRGATGAACAPKPGKAPIMAARCRRRHLFFKIKVRPRPYRVRRAWLLPKSMSSPLNYPAYTRPVDNTPIINYLGLTAYASFFARYPFPASFCRLYSLEFVLLCAFHFQLKPLSYEL